MIYTKKYWSEGEYTTREGEKYTGYVGIKDGKAYIFDIEEELISGDAYITNINISDSFIDRVLAAELKLPYSKSDVQFGANDFLYSSTVIDIVEKLQANNDYIFKNNIISDTTLPSTSSCTIFSSKDKPLYLYQYRDENYNLVKLPKGTTINSEGKAVVNGVTIEIAMTPNYNYEGTPGSTKKYNLGGTAETAYNKCYSNGVMNSTYSSIPFIAIDRELNNSNGGVLSRYNFRDRGFSGVTKIDPYFYSKVENQDEYYINKDEDLIIKSYKTTDIVDNELLKFYRNPNFNYSALKPAISSNNITVGDIIRLYENNEDGVNYTLIPNITRCDKRRYKYKTTGGQTVSGEIGDTYLNIKNKPNFSSLVYATSNKSVNYIPFDYMTADEALMDSRNYNNSQNLPSFLDSSNFWEIVDKSGVVYYISGTGKLSNIGLTGDDLQYINNPRYYSKTYKANSTMTWSALSEILKTDNLINYEYIPVVNKFNHSVITKNASFDFDKVKNCDICINDIAYNTAKGRYATALIFLITENQLAIIKFNEYIDNISYNTESYEAKFDAARETSNVIIIDKVDPSDKASLNFKNLSAVKVYKDNLYLVDEGLNMVLHYDIGYLLTSRNNDDTDGINPFKKYSLTLLNALQGDGTKNDKVYFNGPHHINADEEHVYVVDRGNKSVKVFSHTLNYIKNLQNGYFAQHDIQAVACNPYSFKLENGTFLPKNSVWIFSVQSNRFYLSILVDDNVVYYGQIESLKIDDDAYSWKEEIRSVSFSSSNSNYFYFSTSKRVYKFHCTSPLWPFASLSYYKQHSLNSALVWEQLNYPWNKIPSLYAGISDESAETTLTWGYEKPVTSAEVLNNKCFALCGYDYYDKIPNINLDKQFNGDLVFHFGVLYDNAAIAKFIKDNSERYHGDLTFDNIPSGDKIEMTKSVALFTYIEPDSYINGISDVSFKSYPKYNITSDIGNEYINPLTFNKLIYQVIYNLMQIKEQIFGKFKGAANADGVVVYDAIITDKYFDTLKLIESSNYFIHNNEVVSIAVNRIFEDILTLQENIIKMMQTTFMSSQSFVNSTTKII